MANAQVEIQKVIFDVSDPQITQARVEVELSGDYPIGMKRVYEKSFPARLSILDLVNPESKHCIFTGLGYLSW